MNKEYGQLTALRRLAARIGDVFAECDYASRRMLQLRLAADSHMLTPASAPDTYEEFLFRTSGLLLHEPSAKARATGSCPIR
jgi:hypothetical protein